ncbi:MAG: hypothetical protein ACPIOQ_57600, partial [Promethearchaeia archaeon]
PGDKQAPVSLTRQSPQRVNSLPARLWSYPPFRQTLTHVTMCCAQHGDTPEQLLSRNTLWSDVCRHLGTPD